MSDPAAPAGEVSERTAPPGPALPGTRPLSDGTSGLGAGRGVARTRRVRAERPGDGGTATAPPSAAAAPLLIKTDCSAVFRAAASQDL